MTVSVKLETKESKLVIRRELPITKMIIYTLLKDMTPPSQNLLFAIVSR